jgi:hypothetical protein
MLAPATQETRSRRPKAEERIDARLPAGTKQLIERAAVITGVTLSRHIVGLRHIKGLRGGCGYCARPRHLGVEPTRKQGIC